MQDNKKEKAVHYDLTSLKLLMQNKLYAIYVIGQSEENKNRLKCVRVNKATQEQIEVEVVEEPKPHVVALVLNGIKHELFPKSR